jgi:hypothetical protein
VCISSFKGIVTLELKGFGKIFNVYLSALVYPNGPLQFPVVVVT